MHLHTAPAPEMPKQTCQNSSGPAALTSVENVPHRQQLNAAAGGWEALHWPLSSCLIMKLFTAEDRFHVHKQAVGALRARPFLVSILALLRWRARHGLRSRRRAARGGAPRAASRAAGLRAALSHPSRSAASLRAAESGPSAAGTRSSSAFDRSRSWASPQRRHRRPIRATRRAEEKGNANAPRRRRGARRRRQQSYSRRWRLPTQ